MKSLTIIPYEDKYHKDLKKISLDWLNHYDLYEEIDGVMLDNPRKYILDNGGCILMANYDNKIVGTVTLNKVNKNVFELMKLGVVKEYQGLGIGKELVSFCINYCKDRGIEKITVETNTKLYKAMKLYKKFDFLEVPLDDMNFDLSNFKMELILRKNKRI